MYLSASAACMPNVTQLIPLLKDGWVYLMSLLLPTVPDSIFCSYTLTIDKYLIQPKIELLKLLTPFTSSPKLRAQCAFLSNYPAISPTHKKEELRMTLQEHGSRPSWHRGVQSMHH